MLHDSDNENHEDEHDMGDDFDLDDAVLWGDDDEEPGSDDDSGQDNEMESEEEGEGDEAEIPPQLAFNADGRPALWNLGQLGALCAPSCFEFLPAPLRLIRAQSALASVTSVVPPWGFDVLCFVEVDMIDYDGVIRALGCRDKSTHSECMTGRAPTPTRAKRVPSSAFVG